MEALRRWLLRAYYTGRLEGLTDGISWSRQKLERSNLLQPDVPVQSTNTRKR